MTPPLAEGALIVFLRSPRKGKVKTRLAESVGSDKAYDIYLKLVRHTLDVVKTLSCPIFFFIEGDLPVPSERLSSAFYYLQSNGDLGQRMQEAFAIVRKKYAKAVIIGSDCPGLTQSILVQAFTELDADDVVLGPATDGGYYLLGCKKINPELWSGITWSSSSVLKETIQHCVNKSLTYSLLPELSDVDTLEDYKKHQSFFEKE
jgi:rSAM/selenodomain-associated transferase 1